VAKKLAKLKPAEKADYEARAAEKGQTLEQYVLRRIQKKTEKDANRAKKQGKADKKKQEKIDNAGTKQ
jgi:nucleolar protein TMA23